MFDMCVDTGGTFTDCVILDENGNLIEFKASTTPADLSIGVMDCLEKAAVHYGLTPEQFARKIRTIVHGTTIGVNAFLTRTGARTALITTKGFRDISEIRRGLKNVRTSMYTMFIPPYNPLIPRNLRFTVDERVKYNGEIITPLNQNEMEALLHRIKKEEVESIAICFIHSHANPENEKKALEICRKNTNGIYVCASHEVLPLVGEYPRENTTILNAYIGPIVSKYLTALEEKLKQIHFEGQLLIMQADDLMQSVQEAIKKPVYLMISGPASAPAGAVYLGERMGRSNFVTMDMGGTSLDIGFVKDGEISLSKGKWIEEEMCAIKMVDITTLGAGGGSIAWIDSLGMLRVGPRSAGSDPGPACYGRGGQEPTVTDADLILGYIPEDYFLGGKIKIHKELARSVVKKIGDRLGIPIDQAANSIFSVVNSIMADGISEVTTRNGYDVRDFSLLAAGGAGAIHGAFLAEQLNISEVIIPKFSASYCAWSMFTLDIGRDYLRSIVALATDIDVDHINRIYHEMIDEALPEFKPLGLEREDISIVKSMELRYRSQFHNVEIAGFPDGNLSSEDITGALSTFHHKHEVLYSFNMPSYEVELRGLRLTAKAKKAPFSIKEVPKGEEDPSEAFKRKRLCFFDGGYVETSIYDGGKLTSGNLIDGPAIVEEPSTTVVIPRQFRCFIDAFGNYLIRRK